MRINTRVGMCVIMVGLLGLGCTTLSSFITGLTGTGSGGGLQDIGAAIAAAFSGGGNTQSAAVVPGLGRVQHLLGLSEPEQRVGGD